MARIRDTAPANGRGFVIFEVRHAKRPGVWISTIEATFDAIPQSVNRSVDLDLNTPIFLRGNNRRAAALLDIGANGIRVQQALQIVEIL
jgi:hypothetical protein